MRLGTDEIAQAALDGLDRAVDGLRDCVRLGLPTPELAGLVKDAFTLRHKLEAAVTRLVGQLDEQMSAEQDPHDPSLSCAAWLRDHLRLGGAAWGQVRLARQLRDLPDTADAFAAGNLSYGHAMSISRTVDRVVAGGGRAEDAEPLLLMEAGRQSPKDLLMWGRRLRHRLDPAEMAEEEEQERRRRWLNLTQGWDGGYDVEGYLDAEAGTRFKVALDAVLGPAAGTTSAATPGAGQTAWTSWSAAAWTPASCPCAAARGLTSRS